MNAPCTRNRRRRVFKISIVILLTLYVSSYLILSRLGYAEARRNNARGFYYGGMPQNRRGLRFHQICRVIYAPLNSVDCMLGTGREPVTHTLFREDLEKWFRGTTRK